MTHGRIPLRLGTRGSQLALYQAHTVAAPRCEAGGPPCEIVIIKTSGDRLQEAPLSEVGGKRLFVKEIEDALLERRDRSRGAQQQGHAGRPARRAGIAGVLPREDPRDAVVLAQGQRGIRREPGPGSATTGQIVEALREMLGQHRRSARAACGASRS